MSKDVRKVEVTREDQANINTFNKLNTKMHELEAQVKARKKLLEDLEDAGNELMLSDEDNIRYVLGECFVHMDKEEAEGKLEGMSGTVNEEVQSIQQEIEQTKGKMQALKAVLYGKFGNNINLEE